METNYASCGTCIVLETGCVPHGDHVDCDHTFMPQAGGQVHLDALGVNEGERLTGELLDIEFHEVTIASDFQTTAVEGGEEMHLHEWAFDAPIVTAGGGSEECGGHGSQHGDHCHCDPGYREDPADPTNCIPE